MHTDLIKPLESSFLSCEKDTETILKKLFVENKKHSEELIRLLVINAEDCLDNKENKVYKETVAKATLSFLKKNGYVRLVPKLKMPEFEEAKSYIVIEFEDFALNPSNPQFRNCLVVIKVLCNSEYWDLGNYRMRPLKICGYIDGLLNETRLSGIGKLHFAGCVKTVLDENFCGYSLMYRAIHGSDDEIE